MRYVGNPHWLKDYIALMTFVGGGCWSAGAMSVSQIQFFRNFNLTFTSGKYKLQILLFAS